MRSNIFQACGVGVVLSKGVAGEKGGLADDVPADTFGRWQLARAARMTGLDMATGDGGVRQARGGRLEWVAGAPSARDAGA